MSNENSKKTALEALSECSYDIVSTDIGSSNLDKFENDELNTSKINLFKEASFHQAYNYVMNLKIVMTHNHLCTSTNLHIFMKLSAY